MQGKLRNSELTKQTVDRKQKFTPIPFIDKLSLCVAESLLRLPNPALLLVNPASLLDA